MRDLWGRLRAWRKTRRERYAERWTETKPYDGRADRYLTATPPDTFPPSGGGAP